MHEQKDNSTFREKVALRRRVLRECSGPVICETHGGAGKLYRAVYGGVMAGMVFEKDARKADLLAGQRPTWSVYEADCVAAIGAGAGAHLPVTLLDCDPYGEPWPVLRAWFDSERPHQPRLWLVVNDGLRQKIRLGGAWSTESLRPAVARFGNDLCDRYLDVCRWILERHAAHRRYTVRRFEGYYTGHLGQMTHYAAMLEMGV